MARAFLVDTVRQQFSPKGVMPFEPVSGIRAVAGVLHPATNTAESLPLPDRRGLIGRDER